MKKKILSFIIRDHKLLALFSDPHPEHGAGGWFVVTGEVEEGESHEEAVRREIAEETGLSVVRLADTGMESVYDWGGERCQEKIFATVVGDGDVVLNEEHSRYEWLSGKDFWERIKWEGDKDSIARKVAEIL